jgi:hypothetical protein
MFCGSLRLCGPLEVAIPDNSNLEELNFESLKIDRLKCFNNCYLTMTGHSVRGVTPSPTPHVIYGQ